VQWIAISGIGDYVAVSGFEMTVIGADTVILLNRTGNIVWQHIGVGGEGSHLTKVDMPCHGRSVVAATEDLSNWFGCDLYYFSDGGNGWDSGDGTPVWRYWPGLEVGSEHDHYDDFYTVSISSNGDVISVGGYDGTSYLYVLDENGTVIDINEDGTTLQSVDVTFNGRFTALGTGEGYIALYDKDIGDWKWVWGMLGPIRSVAISKIYPCMFPYPNHDVTVLDVTPLKTIVGQGCKCRIKVTLTNEGDFTESFNIVVYCNATLIGTLSISNLASKALSKYTFTWNTTGFAKGKYTISAVASIVPDEIDVHDNTRVADEYVCVSIVGDLDCDRDVDLYDAVKLLSHYGCKGGMLCYDPICDIDDDGDIDLYDAVALLLHYGQKDP
jgi:hypothetical protein